MSEQGDVQEEQVADEKRASVRRRGLIAGAAALVAATLAKRSMQDVEAADGDALIIGNGAAVPGGYQSASATTWLAASPGNGPTFRTTPFPYPVKPDTLQDGVQGFAAGANIAGIFGRNNDGNGVGLFGEAPFGTGAFGDSSTGSGVAGASGSGAGLFGKSDSGVGVMGTSNSSYGVSGTTSGVNFAGVFG